MGRQAADRDKVFLRHTCDESLFSKIFKEIIKFNNNNDLKLGQKPWHLIKENKKDGKEANENISHKVCLKWKSQY